ncbi:MAG: ATP-binding protein [Deltaproteobacteria bacterium]|nr:ATP-binding protein [Deltaproteobacteria bacterium]
MNLVRRNIFGEILKWLDDNRILLIKGARRTGKTVLLGQIRAYLNHSGKSTALFSADQELDTPYFKNPKLLFKFLSDQFLPENGKLYCLIDECQYLPDAPLFLKVVYDLSHGRIKFIVTGSSSLDLLKIKEPLTGRKIEFTLERFSFKEYLQSVSEYRYEHLFKIPRDIKALKEFYEIYRKDLEYHFISYLNWGGYPEVCLGTREKTKRKYLNEIITTYIEKDISQFFRIESISKFNSLIRLLCSQRACILNRSEVSNTLGIHFKTLEHYLSILEGTFVITLLRPYYTNMRKELSKMPKVFINDAGIIKNYIGTESPDFKSVEGSLVENFVFTQLKQHSDTELFYYRTVSKAEVDFVLKRNRGLIPIEVKFRKRLTVPAVMKNFMSNYKNHVEYGIMLSQETFGQTDQVYLLPGVLVDFLEFA